MIIKKYNCTDFGENCYAVLNEKTRQAVIIDLGSNAKDIYQNLQSMGYMPVAMILTHGHFDHAGGGADIQDLGVEVYISEKDYQMTQDDTNMSEYFSYPFKKFSANHTFKDGDVLNLGGLEFKVLWTPGHTIGSVCFLIDDVMFSGDTLFYLGYGRPDLPTGSFCTIMSTLKRKLFKLEKNYHVYTGHGGETTLEFEKQHNPCLEIDHD